MSEGKHLVNIESQQVDPACGINPLSAKGLAVEFNIDYKISCAGSL